VPSPKTPPWESVLGAKPGAAGLRGEWAPLQGASIGHPTASAAATQEAEGGTTPPPPPPATTGKRWEETTRCPALMHVPSPSAYHSWSIPVPNVLSMLRIIDGLGWKRPSKIT